MKSHAASSSSTSDVDRSVELLLAQPAVAVLSASKLDQAECVYKYRHGYGLRPNVCGEYLFHPGGVTHPGYDQLFPTNESRASNEGLTEGRNQGKR